MDARLTRQDDERMGHVHTCFVLLLCAVVGIGFSLQFDGAPLQLIVGLLGTALCFCAFGFTFDSLPTVKFIDFWVHRAKTVPTWGGLASRQVRTFRPPRHFPAF